MSERQKITKDTVPEGFSLALALEDALPVLLFGISTVLLGVRYKSVLFIFGALFCFWAGAAKVIWKLIVVKKKKNVWWLFMQMRTVMPAGFLLMLVSLFTDGASLSGILKGLVSFPSVIFFLLGAAGMALMGVFAKKLDAADPKANVLEQGINTGAQLCFLIGILLLG